MKTQRSLVVELRNIAEGRCPLEMLDEETRKYDCYMLGLPCNHPTNKLLCEDYLRYITRRCGK